MSAFDLAKKYLDSEGVERPAADPIEGRIQAGLKSAPKAEQSTMRPPELTAQEIIDIDDGKISAVLIDCDFRPFWFAFADDFKPGDDIPTFFASELPHLRPMTPDELRRRYAEKRALGGGWIRDRIEH